MDEEARENYVKAGKAIQKARKKAREITEAGRPLIEIADELESLIREEGCHPAFPVNLSIDDEAAHYTPEPGDDRKLRADDVVKVDIGAHSNGYIADTALTVNPSGEHQGIIDDVEKVLEAALEYLEPGITVSEFGAYVEQQIPDEYEPVRNLTGHYLGRYTQHAGVSIPNVDNGSDHVFEAGDAVAIEPFITTGSGKIRGGKPGNIYKLEHDTSVRGRVQRKLLGEIKNYRGLPFTTRWFNDYGARQRMAMKKLVDANVVHSYDILKEVEGGIVAQAEHTVIIGEDENTVTTRR
ncbi:MAG: type II methionyl aminopeptidase [Candidatus Nanohaloarchaea archaeon]